MRTKGFHFFIFSLIYYINFFDCSGINFALNNFELNFEHVELFENECTLCFDNKIDFITRCNHSFCQSCIDKWLATNSSCPSCRGYVSLNRNLEFILSTNKCRTKKDFSRFNRGTLIAVLEEFLSAKEIEIENSIYLNNVISALPDLDLTILNEDIRVLLFQACGGDHLDLIELLIKKNVNINSIDPLHEFTPLHVACLAGNTKIVKILLKHNANVNFASKNGTTPIHMACMKNRVDIVELLIENGADKDISNKEGMHPIYFACLNNNLHMVRILVENGSDINMHRPFLFMPLNFASSKGYLDIVEFLIEKGARVNYSDQYGYIPLHAACFEGHLEVASLLIKKGSCLNTSNQYGSIPLHLASLNGHLEVVRLLIKNDSNLNTKNLQGKSPLYLAISNKHLEIVNLLIINGAVNDYTTKPKQSDSPFTKWFSWIK